MPSLSPKSLIPGPVGVFPSVSVVIPTLNEERNLPHVLPFLPSWVHEIIIVDGHSTDNTIEVAKSLSDKVKIVMQTRRGKGDALRCGFAAATGDIIVMLDADGSTDPKEMLLYVAPLLSGWHFAKGSRFVQGGGSADLSLYRSLGNKGLMFVARLLFGGSFTDLCYGYNAFWRWTLDYIVPDVDGFEIETLLNIRALRAKLKVAEVPSYEKERIHGVSNLHAVRDGIRILKTIFRERFAPKSTPMYANPAISDHAHDSALVENINAVIA